MFVGIVLSGNGLRGRLLQLRRNQRPPAHAKSKYMPVLGLYFCDVSSEARRLTFL
jgi:hypothetical protein